LSIHLNAASTTIARAVVTAARTEILVFRSSPRGGQLDNQDDSVKAAAGFGLAAFALVLHSLASDVRSGRISMGDAVEIISSARGFLARVPGERGAMFFAENALDDAEQMLSTALAGRPRAGPN
jgi:hypothetical protein